MRSVKAPKGYSNSRWAYRIHRMWLTPLYRSLLRVGVPVFLLITAVGWYFANPTNRYAVVEKYEELRRSVENRPEFMVKLLSVDGATPRVAEEIRALIAVDFPVSSFDLDLEAMQEAIAGLDVIAEAELHVRAGGILAVEVREREPALVWRRGEELQLVDPTGHRVAHITARTARPDLPLIAGEGAKQAAAEALALLRAAGPIVRDLRGLERIGERRWDMVLTSGIRLMLPEENPVAALEQILALDQAHELFARNVSHIDLRNPARPTLRLGAPAVESFHRLIHLRGSE
ncbi:MAG: cell division protein FtsQ [Rhodobacterales bacterium]|nr:MAG: cell division protein FtsQ [Rhodobacterales bacterium]